MRKCLEKIIKKKYGNVCCSKRRLEQRQEIVSNALERYDEEITNGATPQQAYETVVDSLGDLSILNESKPKEHAPLIARIALILGIVCAVFCLFLALLYVVWIDLQRLVDSAVRAYEVIGSVEGFFMSIMLFLMFVKYCGPILMSVSVVLGCIGIYKSRQSRTGKRKGLLFSVISICLSVISAVVSYLILWQILWGESLAM